MAVRAVQGGGSGHQGAHSPGPAPARPLRTLNAFCAAKRKSAVELLQESKAFYVKSDCVRDRHQRLLGPRSSPPSPSPVPPVPPVLLSPPPSPLLSPCSAGEPMPPAPPGFQQDSGPPRSLLRLSNATAPDTPRHCGTTWAQRRTASQQLQSDRLQTKLRRLLNADSKENVCYDGSPANRRPQYDDAFAVTGERATLNRSYGRSNSHNHTARTWPNQASCSLHKSLPDLHTSPTQTRRILPRWSSDNSSTRGSPTSSRSGDGCGYADYGHRRSGSQRGHRSLQYSGDAMSVVSSGGRTQQSHRSQPVPRGGELRRGGSSGSSSGQGRTRANTVSEALIRQSSGGSSGMSSWSPRYRSRPASHYHSPRNSSVACGDECDSRGSRASLGSRGSSHGSDHENFSPSQQCSRVAELCWNFEPRRPILRSKSDISHRYSATSNVPLSPPCQDPAQLEVFFEQLGLDNTEYRYVSRTRSQSSDSPIFFSSVSSVDSNCGGWNAPWSAHSASAAGTGGGFMGSGHSGKNIEQPSIVERNARIIKWLCNCRKAQKEMCQALGNGNMS